MPESKSPDTLGDLLKTLEKSDNLRQLARECGFTPRDLKKRLRQWRRELETETDATPAGARPRRAAPPETPELVAAADLEESPLPARGDQVLEVWTDGASRGNPGPAAVGMVFGQRGGELLCAHGETIGRATNNVAEYQAVLCALRFARSWGVTQVVVRLDSELVARQLTGQYRVKSQDLMPFYRQIVSLMRAIERVDIRHVKREKNTLADRYANLALDGKL